MSLIDREANLVKDRINQRFDELYRQNEEGLFQPYVCLICDQLLKPKQINLLSISMLKRNSSLLKPSTWNGVSPVLADCYRYTGADFGNIDGDDDTPEDWIQEMLLSPRACYIARQDQRRTEGFTVCSSCKSSLQQSTMPKYAIANNYCVGSPPQCLMDLTAVELAVLTPVRTHGYCFSYTGGVQKQLKGSLSYYKVNISSIARAVTHFDVLGLGNNVVVMLYGQMTPNQRQTAQQKNKIRTSYLLIALQWLVLFNAEWRQRNINLDEIRQSLRNPVLIDNSRIVDRDDNHISRDCTSSSNIESTESFQVFFPDGTMAPLTGGQESLQQFQELVQAASQHGYDLEFRSSLMRDAVTDFKDNNLVNACLLQFPYGRGGMHEQRMKSNGSFTCETDITEYVEHLSRLSQPYFHYELFTLMLYNLMMKQTMVRTAGYRVRNKAAAHTLAEEITADDVTEAIQSRLNGTVVEGNGTTRHGSQFLKAVDAVAGAVPHTNEAAKRARRDGEAHQHQFGTASYFLTVTPDDDNSFLVQVYSQVNVDNDHPVALLNDEDLVARAKQRTQLRIKYPGICAYFFELVLDIVIEEVIGWDLAKGRARDDIVGLFGLPEAFTASVEEQGRKTLHSHIQIWVQNFNRLREDLHSPDLNISRQAARSITECMDHVGGCSLFSFGHGEHSTWQKPAVYFPHDCTVADPNQRRKPAVVDDQKLRNLRYREGQIISAGIFAYCRHCTKVWTSEELVESYLINKAQVPGLTRYPDTVTRRLKAMAVEYQKSRGDGALASCIIEAAYNYHSHTTSSCFGKAEKFRILEIFQAGSAHHKTIMSADTGIHSGRR